MIGLEERMKYLRRPHKRSQVAMSSEDNPPAKRPPKPLMPQIVPVRMHATGEDDASHARNVKMLQALSQQVHIGNNVILYICMCIYTCMHNYT